MARAQSIFISYRRSDSNAYTGRIYDRLVTAFGKENIFKDVDNIPFGVDFAEHLDKAVGQCQVVLVVMGKTWATVTEGNGKRRLENPDDFVRIEVESALKRGIPVIPVLLDGVSMPTRDQLPRDLHPLVRRNGTQIGHDPRFHPDMDRLIKGLKASMGVAEVTSEPVTNPASNPVVKAVEKLVEERPMASSESSVPTFSFEVVRVNEKGGMTQREQRSAEYRREDLGKGVMLDMVVIPSGIFQMGSAVVEDKGFLAQLISRQSESPTNDNERPQHNVAVKSFLMGKYPITQEQWKTVAALPKVERALEPTPFKFSGNNRPVENVNWDDAVEFCKRLSRKTGRDYRLPSEAEWEYACRAGTDTAFHYGETITTDLANYCGEDREINGTQYSGSYGVGPKGKYRKQTTDVGSFPTNGFGLTDMHGNVWEWCHDHWHDNYKGAPTDGSAWLSDDENAKRLLRGGSWHFDPGVCRSAKRLRLARDFRFDLIGFRVVCGAPWTL